MRCCLDTYGLNTLCDDQNNAFDDSFCLTLCTNYFVHFIVLCPTAHSNGRKTRRFNQVFLPTQECELWHSLTIHVIVNKWKAHFLHFKIGNFTFLSLLFSPSQRKILDHNIKREDKISKWIFLSNIRLCFMQAYVTIAQSCGDASSQFSHVLTEIIFVEIVFLATGSGYSDCWPYVGIICFKAFSVWDLSFFCSIEIFFDLDI